MADERDDVLTLDNLTEYLKTPKSTLYRLAQAGTLPGRKVGREWRFHKNAIDQWLQQGATPERPDELPETVAGDDSFKEI